VVGSDAVHRLVVRHVPRVDTQIRVRATLDGEEPRELDGEADLMSQWLVASGAISDAVNDPVLAPRTISGMFGEQRFESLVGRLVCADTLVHPGDPSRATVQDERLDPKAVAQSHALLTPIDDASRRPGGFAPKIDPVPGAGEQSKSLNFCRRSV
jgi:hypothetical protein